jgi:phage head maturation protease
VIDALAPAAARATHRAVFPIQARQSRSDAGATTIGMYAVGYGILNLYSRVFVPGAFAESLASFSDDKPLPIGWLHEIPIGKFTTLRDEARGPYLEGPISATSAGQDAAVLCQDGLTAASVGFGIDDYQDVVWADPGDTVSFDTPYGQFTYSFDEYVMYIKRAQMVECSLVLVGADDDARVVAVQSLLTKAEKALPALEQSSSWADAAYSMALLMGGRGAAAFEDLPDLEHHALYLKLAEAYTRHGKTPPQYQRHPNYTDVAFQHDERNVFSDRYLQKTLRAVQAGAGGLAGPLSDETRAEAEGAITALTALTRQPPTTQSRTSPLLELARMCEPASPAS